MPTVNPMAASMFGGGGQQAGPAGEPHPPGPMINVESPIRGVNRVVNREGQLKDTCWDALNVLPFDQFGRKRVAQRGGLVKQYSTRIGHNSGDPPPDGFIQGMIEAPNIVYPPGVVGVPVGNLSDLLPSTTFTGNFGPVLNPNSTTYVNLNFAPWHWQFTTSVSGTNTSGIAEAAVAIFYASLGVAATSDLIVKIVATVPTGTPPNTACDIQVFLSKGDHNAAQGTWVPLTSAFLDPVPGQLGVSYTGDVIVYSSLSNVQIVSISAPQNSSPIVPFGVTVTKPNPILELLSIVVPSGLIFNIQ